MSHANCFVSDINKYIPIILGAVFLLTALADLSKRLRIHLLETLEWLALQQIVHKTQKIALIGECSMEMCHLPHNW